MAFEKVFEVFENTVTEVISTVSGIQVAKAQTNLKANYVGIMPFGGSVSGLFLIETDRESLLTLTSYMAGIVQGELEEGDLRDCVGELANMVCGLTKTKCAQFGIGMVLSTPFSAVGQGVSFAFKKNAKQSENSYSSPEVSVKTHVILV